MKYIFNKLFIAGNEYLFYTFLGIIIVIIVATIFLVIKEVHNDNK